jgi:hypothetical protein
MVTYVNCFSVLPKHIFRREANHADGAPFTLMEPGDRGGASMSHDCQAWERANLFGVFAQGQRTHGSDVNLLVPPAPRRTLKHERKGGVHLQETVPRWKRDADEQPSRPSCARARAKSESCIGVIGCILDEAPEDLPSGCAAPFTPKVVPVRKISGQGTFALQTGGGSSISLRRFQKM